ncbi:MAG: hypothetical protein ACD_2C00210G0013 [uncultured bacterium (gcode 4)]|uniref:Uncharacterized protein n=1 Tax=uncultured bacterium (gcode 4) TaxID=1234023 RepID=K2H0A5_9BACT|nr:MAG: hypothetical protein ACD_2C00210G0013 [uncultured bacterium (gcode 4)]
MTEMESIWRVFNMLLENTAKDPDWYCLEWYLSKNEVRCMVPLKG